MKFTRKKGIKKVSIEHNKKLLWFIIGLIILLVVVIILNSRDSGDDFVGVVEGDLCASDADCVKVQLGCCGCNMGGEEKCVLKTEEESYLQKLEECSEDIFCAAVYSCEIQSCSCVQGKCVEVK